MGLLCPQYAQQNTAETWEHQVDEGCEPKPTAD